MMNKYLRSQTERSIGRIVEPVAILATGWESS